MARNALHSAWTATSGSHTARRLAPFLVVSVVGLIVAGTAVDFVEADYWMACGLMASAGAMVLWAPWGRVPSWAGAIPALTYLLAVAYLRDAAGGFTGGVNPLVLVPVLWLGLYGTRLQLAIVVPAIAGVFFVPILLIGEPKYPDSQWRLAVLFVAVSMLIGPNVQRLIRSVKAQAADALRSEEEIARVADVARKLSTGEGTRRDVCAAACELGDSAFALLWEPTDSGRLAVTAAAGVEAPKVELGSTRERSGAVMAFQTAEPVFITDPEHDERVNERLLSHVRPVGTILFQPVMGRGTPLGVLTVGWRVQVDDEERLRVMVGLVAAEAAIAIERADLLTQLEELADTDELTGLPNRRGWNRELKIAISTSARRKSPLCIALIDVDFFKEVNDAGGHQAGDRLLKAAAAAWRSTLRPADILARPGGDEFSLLLPDCDVAQAQMVLERLRAATPGGSTCSIGVAEWDGEAAERLVERADEALYGAKEAGRDRVVTA